jgi:hypothetical protein
MRQRVLFAGTLLLALACGAQAVRHGSGPATPQTGASVDAGAASSALVTLDASPPVDPLVLLAAAQDSLAPGMREVARSHVELGDGGALELPAPTADTCFRVALASKEVVDVSFVDGSSGASLADARGTNPRLGARGPVCVRKGHASRVSIRGTGAVDAIIWASP